MLLSFFPCLGYAQGTFLYDQQSSTNETPTSGGAQPVIQQSTPIGQSFTPAFSAVGFVRLKLYDVNPNNGLGATLYVNLCDPRAGCWGL